MAKSYRHTQVGTVSMLGMGMGLLMLVIIYLTAELTHKPLPWPANIILGGAMILFVVLLILFSSLTASIEDGILTVHFGLGLLLKKKILLSDVQSAEIVTNPWYYGWGLRLTPHGILWNVAGDQAVKLVFKNGKKFQIGTDDPEGLKQAIFP